jgi:uncharacterized membrane protein
MIGAMILLALAIPVLSIVAIVLAAGTRERLGRLEFRLTGIEKRLAELSAPPLATQPSEPVVTAVAQSKPATAPKENDVPPEPAAVAAPAKPKISLEERFGTQWVVWVGGIALAFGGFFLVRYSIEQGWFGPGPRIVMGALLAALLIAAGEWARRTELHTGVTGLDSAHIPGILTAAGTTIAFADVYAA